MVIWAGRYFAILNFRKKINLYYLTFCFVWCIVDPVSDHSVEVIPVPIPNTEVKLFGVDDTAESGKVDSC